MAKMTDFERPISLPPLKFDSTHSARIHFVGSPAIVNVHWAKAMVQQQKLVCPRSIDAMHLHCRLCESQPTRSYEAADRWIAMGWDCGESHFCLFMGHELTFKTIRDECEKLGVSPTMLQAGNGPDILLQRTGPRTIAMALKETAGRHPDWGRVPSLTAALKGVEQNSHWRSFSSVAELEERYQRNHPSMHRDEDEDDLNPSLSQPAIGVWRNWSQTRIGVIQSETRIEPSPTPPPPPPQSTTYPSPLPVPRPRPNDVEPLPPGPPATYIRDEERQERMRRIIGMFRRSNVPLPPRVRPEDIPPEDDKKKLKPIEDKETDPNDLLGDEWDFRTL